jgi:hypothetical protein
MARAERKSSRVADTAPAAAEEFPTWLEPQLDQPPGGLSGYVAGQMALLLNGRLLQRPVEIRPHLGAAVAASGADELRLQIRQPSVIRPLVAADRRPMATMIIGAIDQQTAHA